MFTMQYILNNFAGCVIGWLDHFLCNKWWILLWLWTSLMFCSVVGRFGYSVIYYPVGFDLYVSDGPNIYIGMFPLTGTILTAVWFAIWRGVCLTPSTTSDRPIVSHG